MFTADVLRAHEHIDYARMSETFSRLIALGRKNNRLRLMYERMDEVVAGMLRKK